MTAPIMPSITPPVCAQNAVAPAAPHGVSKSSRFSELLARTSTADIPDTLNANELALLAMQVEVTTAVRTSNADIAPEQYPSGNAWREQRDAQPTPATASRARHSIVHNDILLPADHGDPCTDSNTPRADAVEDVLAHVTSASHLAQRGNAHTQSFSQAIAHTASASHAESTQAVDTATHAISGTATMQLDAHAGHTTASAPQALAQDVASLTGNISSSLALAATPLSGHGTANPLPATLTGTIAVPVHHTQWSQALGQQVLHLSQASVHAPQVAQLRLDPPELGPLHISLELHNHVAHATFVSAHAPVRLAVENALPALQEQLAQAGIALGQSDVRDQDAYREPDTHAATAFAVGTDTRAPVQTGADTHARITHSTHALIDTFA